MEAHLHLKTEQLQRAENVRAERDTWQPSLPPYKAVKLSSEEVQAKVKILNIYLKIYIIYYLLYYLLFNIYYLFILMNYFILFEKL